MEMKALLQTVKPYTNIRRIIYVCQINLIS